MKKTGPTIAKGQSKQDYATPPDFMAAVSCKFGTPTFDLAASAENTKAQPFYSEQDDSLSQIWHIPGLLWLNPPYAKIAPWAKKCWETINESPETTILMLVPASVGSNWFRDHVFRKARIYFLNGRITFVGCTDPFIKDLMLCQYSQSVNPELYIWPWQQR